MERKINKAQVLNHKLMLANWPKAMTFHWFPLFACSNWRFFCASHFNIQLKLQYIFQNSIIKVVIQVSYR